MDRGPDNAVQGDPMFLQLALIDRYQLINYKNKRLRMLSYIKEIIKRLVPTKNKKLSCANHRLDFLLL